jgi:hypothetical protein
MSLDLNSICASLAFTQAMSEPCEGGFIASVSLDVRRFSQEQKGALLNCLTGCLDSQGEWFLSPVCDNAQCDIVFSTQGEAAKEAITRANSLPNQFIYGAYCTYGELLVYQQPQKLFFMPRNKLKK